MKRIPEPELMDTAEQARAYAAADFSAAHQSYVTLFHQTFPKRPASAAVLDLGCGPADVTVRFAKANPTWIAELRKKREHYLAFLKYPEYMRKSFSTTNVVEAVNGQLEIMRRNSGGYFHSEDTLKLKLGLAISSRENGRWQTLSRTIAAASLNSMPCFNLALRRLDASPFQTQLY